MEKTILKIQQEVSMERGVFLVPFILCFDTYNRIVQGIIGVLHDGGFNDLHCLP